MPIYEYKCEGCGEIFELIQRYSDPPPEKHDKCGSSDVHRIMSPSAFVFKGEGWYITDYARKDKKQQNNTKTLNKEQDKSSTADTKKDSSNNSTSSSSSSSESSSNSLSPKNSSAA
ncbi:MAG: zinc ribbon domain-containing protein [Deltaproteobacteria bacterium]|nr:zinc ribbon domain-containing protein [Deltaproteobacteria bacterium]